MFPYERVVQWLAGPVSALIGLGATALVHQNISQAAAVNTATFVLSTAATYLAHHKWLDNLAKWWNHSQQPAGSQVWLGMPTGSTQSGTVAPAGPDRSSVPQEDGPLADEPASIEPEETK